MKKSYVPSAKHVFLNAAHLLRYSLYLCFLIPALTTAQGNCPLTNLPPGTTCLTDISYGPDARNTLDILMPESCDPTAIIVYFHGGGFVNGDKSSAYSKFPNEIANYLSNNIAFATVNYRYASPSGSPAGVKKSLYDGRRAIQYLRYHATTYHLNENSIGLKGGSAGASLSLWIATHPEMADPSASDPILRESSRVQAIALFNPQASLNFDRLETDIFATHYPSWTVAGAFSSPYFPLFSDYMNTMYGVSTVSEYYSPPITQYRQDVDMLYHFGADDPPVWANCNKPNQVPIYLGTGDIKHHPLHVLTIGNYATSLGIENQMYSVFGNHFPAEDADEFLIRLLSASNPSSSCNDGIQNGCETGVDCGGPDCAPCGPSGPTCDDGIQNGNETGIDCGGPDCPTCPPTCDDGIRNGQETGVDCGGPDCDPCPNPCTLSSIDASGFEIGETFWSVTNTGSFIRNDGLQYSGSRYAITRGGGTGARITSATMDLSTADYINMRFWCSGQGLETGEGLRLEISTNNGMTWSVVSSYRINQEIFAGTWTYQSVTITQSFSAQTILRFQGIGNANNDIAAIDEIAVEQCSSSGSLIGSFSDQEKSITNKNAGELSSTWSIHPNPIHQGASLFMNFRQETTVAATVSILDTQGRLLLSERIPVQQRQFELQTGQLPVGLYFVKTVIDGELLIEKIVIQ